jgi:hypothetical protein
MSIHLFKSSNGVVHYYKNIKHSENKLILLFLPFGVDLEAVSDQIENFPKLNEFNWIVPNYIIKTNSVDNPNFIELNSESILQLLLYENIGTVSIIAHSFGSLVFLELLKKVIDLSASLQIENALMLNPYYDERDVDILQILKTDKTTNLKDFKEKSYEKILNHYLINYGEMRMKQLQKIGFKTFWKYLVDMKNKIPDLDYYYTKAICEKLNLKIDYYSIEKTSNIRYSDVILQNNFEVVIFIPHTNEDMYLFNPTATWPLLIKNLTS